MARTYRIRRYPTFPGSARKFADGIGIRRQDKTEDEIWIQVSNILGTPLRNHTETHRWSTRQFRKEEFDLFYDLEKKATYPIAPIWRHPWVGYRSGRKVKSYWKTQANRLLRHKTKELLNRRQPDFDGTNYFLSSEFFDPWKFD